MRILDRHVLTETAVASGVASGAFIFVLAAGNILSQVANAIATGRVTAFEGLELVGLLLPGLIPYVLPMGMLTGVLMTFGRMGAQHELTAMKAGGLSLLRIAAPALWLAAALALCAAWINLEVATRSNDEYRRVLMGSVKENPASLITPGEINRQFKGLIIQARERNGPVLRDLWIWRLDAEGRLFETIHTAEGRLTKVEKPDGSAVLRLVAISAQVDTRRPGDDGFKFPSVTKEAGQAPLEFPVSGVFKDGSGYEKKLRWHTTSELLELMDKGWQVPPNATPAQLAESQMMPRTQLMAHFASAFSIFSLALLAVPLAVRVGRSETFVNAAIALTVALSYYVLSSAAGWVKNPVFRPDLLVWLPNIIVVTLAVALLRRASKH
ncbi:MAG: LptF/LptG family permease [Opitutales bacterium]|nr:LptF/LptG family permease [Opitutales bacterium]